MKNTHMLAGAVVVIALLGAAAFILSNQKQKSPNIVTSPSPSQYEPEPTTTPSANVSPTSAAPIDLGAGGNSYLDEKGVYSMLYPNDYVLDTQDPQHIRIYKRGDMQRPQSEISDGVVMVFESVELQGSTLEGLVDTRIKESTADGTSELVEGKKAITQGSYPGFSYSMRGLGTSRTVALQKNSSSSYAVFITYSVSDPGQKGYQKQVESVLSTLTLVK